MKREIYAKLLEWKSRRDHKPLVLDGARQVGKTYILKEFGNKEYKTLSYVNLDKDAVAKSIFEPDHDIPRIIRTLSAHTGVDIAPKVYRFLSKGNEGNFVTLRSDGSVIID